MFLNKTDVKISSLNTEVILFPQTVLHPPKKYDYQIKCQPGCCIFNSQSCLLLPPPLSAWSEPPLFPQTLKQTNIHTILWLISSLLQLQSHPPCFVFFFCCCLWSELDSQPTAISPLHWRPLNEGRHISLEDWVSVSPRLLLSLNSLLKYLKSQ